MKMKENKVKYLCTDLQYNPNIGSTMCYSGRAIFFLDKNGIVKIGDVVEIHKDETGFDKKVFVNGKLKYDESIQNN